MKKLIAAVSDLANRREEILGQYEPVGANGYRHKYYAPDAEDIFNPETVLAQSIEWSQLQHDVKMKRATKK